MPKRRPDHVPMRTCAACRQVRAKRSLTRIVRGPDGRVAVDPTGKAAGRGTYICNDDLDGFNPASLQANGSNPVRFALARPAGRFDGQPVDRRDRLRDCRRWVRR